jgi:hypothetical protein
MSRKINYGRQLFIFQQVHHVFQSYKEDLNRRFVTTTNASWTASLVYDMLDNGVGNLCMKPYQDIILKGRAQNFLNTFPRTMILMAHYKRDKVARNYLVLLSLFKHYALHRWDILGTYLSSCCSSNDNFIENHNAQIATLLPNNGIIEYSSVVRASILCRVKQEFLHNKKITLHDHRKCRQATAKKSSNIARKRPNLIMNLS